LELLIKGIYTTLNDHQAQIEGLRREPVVNAAPQQPSEMTMAEHGTAVAAYLEDAGYDARDAEARQMVCLAEEAGEALKAWRRAVGWARQGGPKDAVYVELADVVITAYVTAAVMGFDLDREIAEKLNVIYTRGWKDTDHG
jgi:NTP pyrophosphatase (non-canonical NTP hydrolase)